MQSFSNSWTPGWQKTPTGTNKADVVLHTLYALNICNVRISYNISKSLRLSAGGLITLSFKKPHYLRCTILRWYAYKHSVWIPRNDWIDQINRYAVQNLVKLLRFLSKAIVILALHAFHPSLLLHIRCLRSCHFQDQKVRHLQAWLCKFCPPFYLAQFCFRA